MRVYWLLYHSKGVGVLILHLEAFFLGGMLTFVRLRPFLLHLYFRESIKEVRTPRPLVPSIPYIEYYKEMVQLQEDLTHQSKGEQVIKRLNKNDLQTYTRSPVEPRNVQHPANCQLWSKILVTFTSRYYCSFNSWYHY